MFGVGTFRLPCESSPSLVTTPQNLSVSYFSVPFRTFKTNSFFSYPNSSSTSQLLQGRPGFSLSASKKRTGRSDTFLGTDEQEDEEDDDDEEEDEDEDEEFVPFANMNKWIQNKPSGFGEGRTYHTPIEDELLEEMQQSRKAQLANINKLKNSSPNPDSGKNPKVVKVAPRGIRVRIGNLPKKKNIHRDLKLAFQGFPGILNISPAVSGNKKTKDPICKGFAFVYLDSEEAARRFISEYGRQSLPFGKIQKQITCEMSNPSSNLGDAFEQSQNGSSASELNYPGLKENPDRDSDVDNLSIDFSELTNLDESAGSSDEIIPAEWEESGEDPECVIVGEPDDIDGMEVMTELVNEPVSSKQKQKSRAVEKKKPVKTKVAKVPKLSVPGSAKRLKIKEKAVLTGAFSKYGVKSPS